MTTGFVQMQYRLPNRNYWPLLATWFGQKAMRRKSYRVVSFPILYKHGTWASPVLRLLEKAPIRKTVRSKPVTGCLLQGLKIAPERTKVILWSLIHPGVWKAKFEPFLGFTYTLTHGFSRNKIELWLAWSRWTIDDREKRYAWKDT